MISRGTLFSFRSFSGNAVRQICLVCDFVVLRLHSKSDVKPRNENRQFLLQFRIVIPHLRLIEQNRMQLFMKCENFPGK